MGNWFSINDAMPQQQQQMQKRQQKRINELFREVEDDIGFTQSKIRSLMDVSLDKSSVVQLYSVTCEAEERLSAFNWKMYHHHGLRPKPRCPDPAVLVKLQSQNKALSANIQLLEREKQYLDGLLTNTMRQRKEDAEQKQSERSQDKYRHKTDVASQQAARIKDLEEDLQKFRQENSNLKAVVDSHDSYQISLKKQLEEQRNEIKTLIEDNESLKLRLSKLAGRKLTENNPAIADLSDPHRPTKLGEMYIEIYDNEWPDAFEQLSKAGYSEKECIETLKLTLLNILKFCQQKTSQLLQKTEEAVNCLFEEYQEVHVKKNLKHLTMPRKVAEQLGRYLRPASVEDDKRLDALCRFEEDKDYIVLQRRWKPKSKSKQEQDFKLSPNTTSDTKRQLEVVKNELKNFRKEVAESMVPVVQKAYISASWSDDCLPALKPFIKKCLLLGWMMVVQSPPMDLATCEKGDMFDRDRFKDYTRSGRKVEFLVWPAILLKENGPVIAKGVAQGHM